MAATSIKIVKKRTKPFVRSLSFLLSTFELSLSPLSSSELGQG